MLIKRKEVILGQVSIFISIILIINLINLTLRHRTDLPHTSLMIFDTLCLAHQSNLTVLFEHIFQNSFAFLCECTIGITKTYFLDVYATLYHDLALS